MTNNATSENFTITESSNFDFNDFRKNHSNISTDEMQMVHDQANMNVINDEKINKKVLQIGLSDENEEDWSGQEEKSDDSSMMTDIADSVEEMQNTVLQPTHTVPLEVAESSTKSPTIESSKDDNEAPVKKTPGVSEPLTVSAAGTVLLNLSAVINSTDILPTETLKFSKDLWGFPETAVRDENHKFGAAIEALQANIEDSSVRSNIDYMSNREVGNNVEIKRREEMLNSIIKSLHRTRQEWITLEGGVLTECNENSTIEIEHCMIPLLKRWYKIRNEKMDIKQVIVCNCFN